MQQSTDLENWLEFLLQHAEDETQSIFEIVNDVLNTFYHAPNLRAA